jgi:hypothetical protein
MIMNDPSNPFEWFPRTTELNCEVKRVIRDVDELPSRSVLPKGKELSGGRGKESKLTTSPTKNVLDVSP